MFSKICIFEKTLKNIESVILIPKVLLDSGIYQGDLKRGVPHGEVGVDSIVGFVA